MKNPFYFSIRYPKATLLILLLLTVIIGLGIRQLETRNSFTGELPATDPINLAIEAVKTHFGERSVVLIGIEADNIYTPSTAKKIKQLSLALQEIPYVQPDEILSLATVSNVSKRSWGLETNGFLEDIPQAETGWQQLRTDVENNPTVANRLVSSDGTLAVIAAVLDDDFDGGEVYDAIKDLANSYATPEKIYITGAPILVEDVQRGISSDSRRFIAIAIVLIFIGFFICFRRLSGVLLPVAMVITSIIWTMGIMGYLGLPITVVSNALPVIMIAVASSYGIHFMNTYYNLAEKLEDRKALAIGTLQKIGMPIFITGLTSSLSSASLLIFKITSLQQFGIIGAIGFALATLICLTLLPATCTLLPTPKKKNYSDRFILPLLHRVTTNAQQYRWGIIGIYTLLIPVFLFYAGQIKVGDDYLKFFPKNHEGRLAATTFNEKLNGVRVMDIVVDASNYGGIKDEQFFQEMEDFQRYLNNLPNVGSSYSYCDLVKHLHISMNENPTATPTNEEIAQYLMLHEMSATPNEVFAIRSEDDQLAKVQLFLKSSDPEQHKVLYEQIQETGSPFFTKLNGELNFGGDVMHRIALGSYIVKGKIQNIALALLIVLLSCLIIFRSLTKGLLTLLPILVSLIMVFGIMGMIGIRLGISTSLLTAMIVGIGIDFAIHYLVSFLDARKSLVNHDALLHTSAHTGRAITYDAISNIAGFSVLSFSGFLPVQHFGWLLAFSMLLIFLNTLLLYPAFLGRPASSAVRQVNPNLQQMN